MLQAENHELLLSGARGPEEFDRAFRTAKNMAVIEEINEQTGWGLLTFADGSRLSVGMADRVASAYTEDDAAEYHRWAQERGLS